MATSVQGGKSINLSHVYFTIRTWTSKPTNIVRCIGRHHFIFTELASREIHRTISDVCLFVCLCVFVTCDKWQVTRAMWHVTHDILHVTSCNRHAKRQFFLHKHGFSQKYSKKVRKLRQIQLATGPKDPNSEREKMPKSNIKFQNVPEIATKKRKIATLLTFSTKQRKILRRFYPK